MKGVAEWARYILCWLWTVENQFLLKIVSDISSYNFVIIWRKYIKFHVLCCFFHLGFLSWTLTINKRVRGRDWKNVFIYLLQLRLLTNIPIFFVVLQLRRLPSIFNCSACCKPDCCNQAVTRWDLPTLWELAFDWFDWLHLLDIIRLSLRSNEFESVQLLQMTPTYLTRTGKFLRC